METKSSTMNAEMYPSYNKARKVAALHAKRYRGVPGFVRVYRESWHDLAQTLTNDGVDQELRDYNEYLEGKLYQPADLSWAGLDVFKTEERHTSKGPYHVVSFTCGATVCFAIREIAQKFSVRSNEPDARAYEGACQSFLVSIEDMEACCVGTLLMTAAYQRIHAEEQRRANMKVHFHVEKPQQVSDPESRTAEKVHLKIPPALAWHHACNELMGEPVYNEFPQLDEAWRTLVNSMPYRDEAAIEWVGTRTSRPAPAHEATKRLYHPTYGKYGKYQFQIKDDCVATMNRYKKMVARPTASIAYVNHIPAMMPRWNRRSDETIAYAAGGRIFREPVPVGKLDRRLLEGAVDQAVEYIIQKIERTGLHPQDITPDHSWRWLASTRFPASKKAKYAEAFSRVIKDGSFIPSDEFSNVHSAFPKNESYLEGDKAQRLILAGDLEMAAVLGPACALLGNHFFSLDVTSKKIPEPDRPRIALERFGDNQVILNDMSAFEGSIDEWVKSRIENRILKYFFPNISQWVDRCNEPLNFWCGNVHVEAPTMRCSGDPQTSLGNSLTNYASILAAYTYSLPRAARQEASFDDIICWVEGDDSLVAVPHRWSDFNEEPDENGVMTNTCLERYRDAFVKMGFATKMELADFVGDAGYCSMFFTPDLILCPRVSQTFLEFAWNHTGYLGQGLELLRLKASSLDHTSPGQPLTWALARHYSHAENQEILLEFNVYDYEELVREGYNVRVNDRHMIVTLPSAVYGSEPTHRARELFESKYGISIHEQKRLEKHILANGPIGIIMTKGASYSWTSLYTLCEKDGINLTTCRLFYDDNVSDYMPADDQELVCAKLKRDKKSGQLKVKNFIKPTVSEAPVDTAAGRMPIDPATYHLQKADRKRAHLLKLQENPYYRKAQRLCRLRAEVKKHGLTGVIAHPLATTSIMKDVYEERTGYRAYYRRLGLKEAGAAVL